MSGSAKTGVLARVRRIERRVAPWMMQGNGPAVVLYGRTGFAATNLPVALAAHPCHEELRTERELVPG